MGVCVVILSYTFIWAINNISDCLWNERRLNNICNQEFSLYEKIPIAYHLVIDFLSLHSNPYKKLKLHRVFIGL